MMVGTSLNDRMSVQRERKMCSTTVLDIKQQGENIEKIKPKIF